MDQSTSKEIFQTAIKEARDFVSKQTGPERRELTYQIVKNIRGQCRVRLNASGQELADMTNRIIDDNVGSLNG